MGSGAQMQSWVSLDVDSYCLKKRLCFYNLSLVTFLALSIQVRMFLIRLKSVCFHEQLCRTKTTSDASTHLEELHCVSWGAQRADRGEEKTGCFNTARMDLHSLLDPNDRNDPFLMCAPMCPRCPMKAATLPP